MGHFDESGLDAAAAALAERGIDVIRLGYPDLTGVERGRDILVALPDLGTLRDVPWEPGVAHVIADVFNPDGTPSQESPRTLLKRVATRFAELGLRPRIGPELEFHVLQRDPAAPTGWQRYGDA